MKKIHFCSGLPRTGSTVLMNILQQNPYTFTTGSCALPGLLKEHVLMKSRMREHFIAMSAEQADTAMYGFVKGGAQGWFDQLTNKPIVISKNRSWSDLLHLFPESKVIVCVRDIRDIVESFEKFNGKIKALHSFGNDNELYPAMTNQEKFDYFFNEPNALSVSLNKELQRLMELFKKDSSRVKFIRYEDFLKHPVDTLKQVENFLQIPAFNYDLNNIKQSELVEHDHSYFRERTSHTVQNSMIKWQEPKRLLSKDFHSNVVNNHKWFYEGFYPGVIENEY